MFMIVLYGFYDLCYVYKVPKLCVPEVPLFPLCALRPNCAWYAAFDILSFYYAEALLQRKAPYKNAEIHYTEEVALWVMSA